MTRKLRWPRSTFPFSISRSPFTFICASFFAFSVSRSPFALICASRFAFSVSRSPFALICASRFPFFYIIILRNALICERSLHLTPFFDCSKTVPFFYRSISVLFPFRCTHRTTVLTVPLYGKVNVNFFWPQLYFVYKIYR